VQQVNPELNSRGCWWLSRNGPTSRMRGGQLPGLMT